MLSAEQRIAAALKVLDQPRAVIADLVSVNEAVEILRGAQPDMVGEGKLNGLAEEVEPTLGSQEGPAPG